MTVSEQLETILAYYTQQGAMSDAGEYEPLLRALPEEIPALVQALQGLVLHVFWVERYGVQLSDERKAEVQIRPVKRKLARLLEIDPQPLTEARPPELRLAGNCRDFSLLLAATLRAHSIPARARCGFGTYFIPGHYEDHWMTEYWRAGDSRWVQVDSQLDELQQQVLGIQFDPLDMPPGQFVLAGAAWLMCRRGETNPDDFGIFDLKGWDFIKGDLLHDFRSLNKMEDLPWDGAGLVEISMSELTSEQMALLDHIAELTLAGNEAFAEIRAIYGTNEELRAPESWAE